MRSGRAASPARRASAPSDPGVATGLAVTAVGGDVLFIEATAYPGKGRLQITGQLGEVMQESAQAALSWVRSHAERARDRPGLVRRARRPHPRPRRRGAEGRPLGRASTMATAIVSLVTGRTVSDEVGMTGEITLTGQVLQIGGVREKVLAAQRAGLKKVILPRENEADLAELPEETREEIEFVLADDDRGGARRRRSTARPRPRRPRPAPERQAAASASRSVAEQQAAGLRLAAGRAASGRAASTRRFPRRTKVIRSTRPSPSFSYAISYCRERMPDATTSRRAITFAVQLVRERARDRVQLLRDLREQRAARTAAQRQSRSPRRASARRRRGFTVADRASCETFHEAGAENVNPGPTTRWP